jgi:hypothetical protein
MARSGDVFTFSGAISTWAGPATADVPSISGWNALRTELIAGLSDSFSRSGTGTMAGPFLAAAGTQALPGISFAADPNTGFYQTTGDEVLLGLGNALRYTFKAGALVGDNNTSVPTSSAVKTYVDTYVGRAYGSYYLATLSVTAGTSVVSGYTNTGAVSNVAMSGGGLLTFNTTGIYRITFSMQAVRTSGLTDLEVYLNVGGSAQTFTKRSIVGTSSIQYHLSYSGIYSGSPTVSYAIGVVCGAASTFDLSNISFTADRVG